MKSDGYRRTRRTRVFLCASSPDESGSKALEWCIEELVSDDDELVVVRGFDAGDLGQSFTLVCFAQTTVLLSHDSVRSYGVPSPFGRMRGGCQEHSALLGSELCGVQRPPLIPLPCAPTASTSILARNGTQISVLVDVAASFNCFHQGPLGSKIVSRLHINIRCGTKSPSMIRQGHYRTQNDNISICVMRVGSMESLRQSNPAFPFLSPSRDLILTAESQANRTATSAKKRRT